MARLTGEARGGPRLWTSDSSDHVRAWGWTTGWSSHPELCVSSEPKPMALLTGRVCILNAYAALRIVLTPAFDQVECRVPTRPHGAVRRLGEGGRDCSSTPLPA
ncbi:hypothetical protein GCM10010842_19840 [Deinococcus daejeonensis]|uniref:Uncharacterized protein n=1 Tax=Deinococcus daejeonensis TaxID=1007098 RepID=A0ABQ2J301_9DEIO|nr:hypothetical protein GCM10010842_19840 [Deinococcus daejeonensis]